MDVQPHHPGREPDHPQPGFAHRKEGQVIADVDATTIKGKVRIGTTDWSAHSNGL